MTKEDEALEREIQDAYMRWCTSCEEDRQDALDRLMELARQRRPERVREMEQHKGLSR